jgi:hypothetical protein
MGRAFRRLGGMRSDRADERAWVVIPMSPMVCASVLNRDARPPSVAVLFSVIKKPMSVMSIATTRHIANAVTA